ncbi:MAG: AMP-binding protein [Gammaproteobacteria bacterium]
MSLSRLFDNAAARFADRIALDDGQRQVSYRALAGRTNRFGQALLGLGLAPQRDHLVSLQNNATTLVEFEIASARFGFARSMLNARAPAEEHAYCAQLVDAAVFVFQEQFTEQVERLRAQLPTVRHWICIGRAPAWALSYDDLLARARDRAPAAHPLPGDVHSIYFTSGTTGRSKGVVLTQRNWTQVVTNFMVDALPRIARDDVALLCAPISHATGGLVYPHLARGARLRILDHFDPVEVARLLLDGGVTSSFMAPTMIQLLLQGELGLAAEKLRLKGLLYGGASFPVDRLEDALAAFGPVLVQGYGQWEAPILFTTLQPEEHLAGLAGDGRILHSAGRAVSFAQVGIMDDEGRLLAPGETGEIVTAGEHVMREYHRNPEATAEIRHGQWQRTGDVGEMDEQGFVYITDRKKDMIITGGNNVYPRQVEEVLYRHEGVLEACVVGLESELWGETVHAVVVPRPGVALEAASILGWTHERLPTDRRPRSVDVVAALPKNHYGKILRREIRDEARARHPKGPGGRAS